MKFTKLAPALGSDGKGSHSGGTKSHTKQTHKTRKTRKSHKSKG